MNLGKISSGKIIYFLIVAAFFYALILFFSDINKIILVLNEIKFEEYLLILPLTILTLLIYGWRYKIVLNKLDIPLNFKDCFLIHTASIAMIITPGSVGLIISNYLLKKKTGHSISSTVPILIFERWLDVVSLTTIIGILLFWNDFIASQIIFMIGLALSGFIFFVFKNSVGLNFLNKILIKTKILKKFVVNTEEFQATTKKLISLKTMIYLFAVTFLIKIVVMISIFLVFDLFNLNINFIDSNQIFLTNQFMGVLSFIPGGLIITETGLLGSIVNTGTDFSIATLLVLLIRIMTFWLPVFIGFIVLKFVLKKY
mgnify:CR=1 FL=1|tara:strand:- start:1364 stop:2305 length:942 start_codon:yes stop_codon:yes gene_type:complete